MNMDKEMMLHRYSQRVGYTKAKIERFKKGGHRVRQIERFSKQLHFIRLRQG